MDPSVPPHPLTFAERAVTRKPVTRAEEAEIREEMRREASLISAMIETYGHPFDGIESCRAETDEASDAA